MKTLSFKFLGLVAAACLLGSPLTYADTGINKLFEKPKPYDTPPQAARLVAAATFTFDTLDTVEKVLLVMAAEAKRCVDQTEQLIQTHPRDVNGPGDERVLRNSLVLLKRRQLAGMPLTMRELKDFKAPRLHRFDNFIQGPYSPSKPEARDLWSAFDTVKAMPDFRKAASKQYEECPLVDPFGLPFGPFAFNQPVKVTPETKAAFKAAAKAINWQDEHLPEALRKVGTGLVDETFWGAYR